MLDEFQIMRVKQIPPGSASCPRWALECEEAMDAANAVLSLPPSTGNLNGHIFCSPLGEQSLNFGE